MIKISPSILAADFSMLWDEVSRVEKAGVELLHIDVMDGHFVPNISLGAPVIKSLRARSHLFFDVHLMIDNPEKLLAQFVDAGADGITVHYETCPQLRSLIGEIAGSGCAPAVAIKPGTPAQALFPFLDSVKMVLVMTVEPGFGGQSLIAGTLEKVRILRDEINRRCLKVDIQVDGGITPDTIKSAASSGANVFVAGSAVFRAEDPACAIQILRGNAAEVS